MNKIKDQTEDAKTECLLCGKFFNCINKHLWRCKGVSVSGNDVSNAVKNNLNLIINKNKNNNKQKIKKFCVN